MKHRHKTHTAGYNARILSSNTSSILLKSSSILSKLRGSSAQCTLSDMLLAPFVYYEFSIPNDIFHLIGVFRLPVFSNNRVLYIMVNQNEKILRLMLQAPLKQIGSL